MRIGIVNDMTIASEALRRAIALAPEHEVIWSAKDGAQAVEFCAMNTPDLILMDLIMPIMDGVEATRRIMAATPCTILIVTVNIGTNSAQVFEAMGHGALDAVNTPALGAGDPLVAAAPLLAKIATIARRISHRSRFREAVRSRQATLPTSSQTLVAIGASAGGPAALAKLLGGLPKTLGAPVVLIQHVDERFAEGMAEWLSQHSPLPVRLARDGDIMAAGEVLLAGTSDHLILTSGERLGYTPEPRDYAYRPSVDVFFHSVSQLWRGNVIGVLLTGMGADGANGLKALRDKGHFTVAQDKATSAVYGMPKAAAAINAAVDILPLPEIAPRLIGLLAATRAKRATA